MPFLDGKVQDLFAGLLTSIRSLAQHCSDETDPHPAHVFEGGTLKLPVGNLNLTVCKVRRRLTDDSFESRNALKAEIREQWSALAGLVRRRYVKYRIS